MIGSDLICNVTAVMCLSGDKLTTKNFNKNNNKSSEVACNRNVRACVRTDRHKVRRRRTLKTL